MEIVSTRLESHLISEILPGAVARISVPGNASISMRRYYSILEKYWMRPRKGKWFFGLCNIEEEIKILDPNLIREAWQQLINAESQVNGIFKKRVDDVKNHFEYTYRFSEATNAAIKARDDSVNSKYDILEKRHQIVLLLKNSNLFHEVYKAYWKTDPRYMSRHFTDHHFHDLIKSWHKYLNECLKEAILKIVTFDEVKADNINDILIVLNNYDLPEITDNCKYILKSVSKTEQ